MRLFELSNDGSCVIALMSWLTLRGECFDGVVGVRVMGTSALCVNVMEGEEEEFLMLLEEIGLLAKES
jgi:hypothetical protein